MIYAVACVCYGAYAMIRWISLRFEGVTKLKKFAEVSAMQIGIFAVVSSVFKFYRERNTIIEIIGLLSKVDATLLFVGVRQNYKKEFKVLAVRAGVAFWAISTTHFIAEVVYWQTNISPRATAFMFLQTAFRPTLDTVVIIFLNVMTTLNKRLRQLNQRLENLYETENSENIVNVREIMGIGSDTRYRDSFGKYNAVVQIEIVHSLLHNMLEKIVGLFSLPLTAVIGTYSLNILNGFYFTYNILPKLLINLDNTTVLQMAATFTWTLVRVLELFAVAHACSSIQRTVSIRCIIFALY